MFQENYIVAEEEIFEASLATQAAEERAITNYLEEDYTVQVLYAEHIDLDELDL